MDFLRRADLCDLAVEHDDDAVGHNDRLRLIMGDVDRGDSHTLLQITDEEAHVVAKRGVEIGERFVQQQNGWLNHKRPCKRHALLLAAGQLPRESFLEADQLNHAQHIGDAALAFGLRDVPHL